MIRITLVGALALSLFHCSKAEQKPGPEAKGANDSESPNAAKPQKKPADTPTPKKEPSMQDAPPKVEVSPEELAGLAKSHNALGLSIWKQAAPKGNAVMSPASIGIALGMTYLGAQGDTAKEMRAVLHINADNAAYARAHAGLLHAWLSPEAPAYEGAPPPPVLRVANRIFVEKTLDVVASFLDVTKTSFAAPAELVDFAQAPDQTRVAINQWVSEHTKERIKDLIPPPAVNGDTRMVLTNALYFKAQWNDEFNADVTQERAFFALGSQKKMVPTMKNIGHFAYRDTDAAEILDLPYTGQRFVMSIVLPKKRDGLAATEKSLLSGGLASWFSSRPKYERMRLEMPRFKVAPENSLDLGDALKALGMPLAFDDTKADFTGIHVFKNPADRLLIGGVYHKGFVEVDEKGTEAAAATAVVMMRAGSAPPTGEPKPFIVDHPFLFLIRDTKTGMIMFMGRVVDPS